MLSLYNFLSPFYVFIIAFLENILQRGDIMKFLRGIALFFCAFFAIVLGFKIFSVPAKINMTEGYSQSMSISFPFSISTDKISQPVVSINNSASNVEIQPVKSGNTLLN